MAAMTVSWAPGDLLTHRDNPELGVGRVLGVSGRALEVLFPTRGERLNLSAASSALEPLKLTPGQPVRTTRGHESVVTAVLHDGRVQLADGQVVDPATLWPVDEERDLVSRLRNGDLDPAADFALRLAALRLHRLREATGLGTFLGGRIRLFPHQLHVAEHATAADPVRWLLADEVGLGKTVEACLVLNHLLRTRRVERCLVIAPATLTVQWLGELWRKYHQVFVLLDQDRLRDVVRDFGRDFNPFDTHRQAVIALETLIEHPRLGQQAMEAGLHLLVVDEAHRLRRPPGHPGEPAYRTVAPLAAAARHLLLLTATPLEDDAHGFFRLLQLLRPLEFPESGPFAERIARDEPLPPCTSSTRREDIGGLPPRVAVPVVLGEAESTARRGLELRIREAPAEDVLARRRKLDRTQRALASGAALLPVLARDEEALRACAAAADRDDPRVAWLAASAREWKARGEKTLVFAAHRETVELLRTALTQRAQIGSATFHEDMSPASRDLEVAQFRQAGGPSVLVATECGGEGRNFEFCHRLVLFDLPWNPVTVEQRIGRLDRIGRSRDVEIVYFRPGDGMGAAVVQAFEAIGLFREPLAGLEPELASVEAALHGLALGSSLDSDASVREAVAASREARERVRAAAYRELHRNRFRPELAPGILERVPLELDGLTEEVITGACARLGIHVEHTRGERTFAIELGHETLVSSLPGVPGGASFLGTFSREEGVSDEMLDFFGNGHPLVEGVLAYLDESAVGRVTALRLPRDQGDGLGLLALYRDSLHGYEAVAIDAEGKPRPEWADQVVRKPASLMPAARHDLARAGGAEALRQLASHLNPGRTPAALAVLVPDSRTRSGAPVHSRVI